MLVVTKGKRVLIWRVQPSASLVQPSASSVQPAASLLPNRIPDSKNCCIFLSLHPKYLRHQPPLTIEIWLDFRQNPAHFSSPKKSPKRRLCQNLGGGTGRSNRTIHGQPHTHHAEDDARENAVVPEAIERNIQKNSWGSFPSIPESENSFVADIEGDLVCKTW